MFTRKKEKLVRVPWNMQCHNDPEGKWVMTPEGGPREGRSPIQWTKTQIENNYKTYIRTTNFSLCKLVIRSWWPPLRNCYNIKPFCGSYTEIHNQSMSQLIEIAAAQPFKIPTKAVWRPWISCSAPSKRDFALTAMTLFSQNFSSAFRERNLVKRRKHGSRTFRKHSGLIPNPKKKLSEKTYCQSNAWKAPLDNRR